MATGAERAGITIHEERERKYDVGPAFDVDELAGAMEVLGGVARRAPVVLLATYFDTDALAVARSGATLRRRQGGSDAGWHLKLPGSEPEVRSELHAPLGSSAEVPGELRAALGNPMGAAPLRPVAHLRTERSALELAGPGGEPLAEVAEDRVVALGQPDGALCAWREVEVEVRGGDPTILDEVERLLLERGARRAFRPSKVAHVLLGPAVGGKDRQRSRPDPVAGRLARQVAELLRAEAGARSGDVEAVHEMRVATRRLRSCLHTFRKAFVPRSTEDLRQELSFLGDVLGAERDAGVLAARLEADLAALDPDLVLGPVSAVLGARGTRETAAAHQELLALLDAPRYRSLLEALVALVARPPFARRRRSRSWYRRQVARSLRRTETLIERVTPLSGAARDAALHEVRKAAKHVRYAAETAAPVLGSDARRLTRAFEELQEVLGEHHDAVVARAVLREEGGRAGVEPAGSGFTFGLLFAVEDARAAAAAARFAEVWPSVRRRVR